MSNLLVDRRRMMMWVDSPYDATTTAYLKTTYPNYWNDIKDYGLTHPSLVPFVNIDNELICALVNVGRLRYVSQYNTTMTSNIEWGNGPDIDIEVDFKRENYHNNYNKIISHGQTSGWQSGLFYIAYNGTSSNIFSYIGGEQLGTVATTGEGFYTMRIKNGDGFWVNGAKIGSTTRIATAYVTQLSIPAFDYIRYITVLDGTNNIDWYLVPYIVNNIFCMLDINSAQIITNSVAVYHTYFKDI